MRDLSNVSLFFRSYKCFGPDAVGYRSILPFNVIIGRNNSGKTALLDLLDYACEPRDVPVQHWHAGKTSEILVTDSIPEPTLLSVFQKSTSGGGIPGRTHWEFGKKWIQQPLTRRIRPTEYEFISVEPPVTDAGAPLQAFHRVARIAPKTFEGLLFRRLASDRDVVPELDAAALLIAPNGSGFTNVVQNFVNKSNRPSALIEQDLLRELNRIFEPDATFTRITVQQHPENDKWEIFLEETTKGRVALSHTGSGIKTVLLALGFVELLPVIEGRSLEDYLFGFEELEHNLHPAVQRRLLLYLRESALKRGFRVFTTTHSHVVIDLFAADSKAQLLHVTHDGHCSSVKAVTTYVENRGLLDDLDVRASDLLQANGIVWVEGPSDRLYFNRWIELGSEGQLREGVHYQCVFYGGRLLAHLSATDPTVSTDEAVKILRVNRNAMLLIDSDRPDAVASLNDTKQRMISEIEALNGFAWVTKGREVENYLTPASLSRVFPDWLVTFGPFDDLAEALENAHSGEGKRFARNKVLFAERAIWHFDRSDLATSLDLEAQVGRACETIRQWNRLPVPASP
jgi:putative ATP-dependent endonuclease of the OLD family